MEVENWNFCGAVHLKHEYYVDSRHLRCRRRPYQKTNTGNDFEDILSDLAKYCMQSYHYDVLVGQMAPIDCLVLKIQISFD